MMTRLAVGFAALAGVAAVACGATHETAGRIDAVTVYRGQALVTRLVEIPGPAGLHEVVVTDLPERIVPGSIYAESADGVAVRSVRYRVRPVAEDVRDEVRKLDEEMEAKMEALDALERSRRVLGEERAYLDRLNDFTAPTATAELRSGVLNAETLRKLTLFTFEQRKRLSDEELTIDRQKKGFEQALNLLRRKRGELTGVSARTVREAVVFADLREATGGLMRVRYLVDDAMWSPSYNVRTEADNARVLLEYNAAIQQRSGEDWTDVAMTLSTATPTLVARAPELTPLRVALAEFEAPQAAEQYKAQFGELMRRKAQMENYRNAPMAQQQGRAAQQALQPQADTLEEWTVLGNRANDLNLNSIAAELQVLDLVAPGRTSLGKGVPREEGVSVTYLLTGRTTLPSRSDRQSIQIAGLNLPADFYKVATPVLTDFVYDEASLTNASPMVLLAGPVAAYAGGQFVGHGEIPMVAAGERFAVGLGIDSSLRAGRELVERRESIRGGNRVVTFKYRLVVNNFADAPAVVRLLDRLPKAKDAGVQVTLAESGKPLCDDRDYQHGPRKDGILRWDAEVPGAASGPDAFAIDYEFQLEYDKAKSLTGLAFAD